MAHKVAILDDYQHVALKFADWSPISSQITVDVYDDTILNDEDALVKRLEPYEIICAMRERTKFPSSLLGRLPNLKLIATTGMRNRGIDVEAAKQKGIVVSGTGGAGNATLEQIWALIFAVTKNVVLEDAQVKAGNKIWQLSVPAGLGGLTIGLVGLGKLGIATANIAKAFDMRVIAWSPNLTADRASAAGVGFASTKEELLKESDIVSIHIVLSPRTEGLITRSDLELMKPTAYFVNTSRGPIVDEAALVDVLKEKKIRAAGLDVFDLEPMPLDHPLRKLDNVTLSPHLGYVTEQNYKVFWAHTVENIAAYLSGKPSRVME